MKPRFVPVQVALPVGSGVCRGHCRSRVWTSAFASGRWRLGVIARKARKKGREGFCSKVRKKVKPFEVEKRRGGRLASLRDPYRRDATTFPALGVDLTCCVYVGAASK